jgi:hypothetical protein
MHGETVPPNCISSYVLRAENSFKKCSSETDVMIISEVHSRMSLEMLRVQCMSHGLLVFF